MIKILTDKNCPHCKKLKKLLNLNKINYVEVDVDNKINKNEVDKIFSMAEEPIIPIIIIPPHVLVPKKSFNTIEDAIKLIIKLRGN